MGERKIDEKKNKRIMAKTWDMVALSAMDNSGESTPVRQSGWISSITGEYFSDIEMQEYADNVKQKILKYCTKEKKVLEIGVASGITCFAIAPQVHEYIGVDLSRETLRQTAKTMESKEITNVRLLYGAADEIDSLDIQNIDIVIINSVAQYFPNYDYFADVVKRAVSCMSNEGIIFVGDILDLDKKEEFQNMLSSIGKKSNLRDLYYSKEFIKTVAESMDDIRDCEITGKIGTIQNELTMYRYDAIYFVDKKR